MPSARERVKDVGLTRATTYVTFDRGVFKTYEVTNECKLALGTTVTTQVIDKGKVELQFTFEKIVTLLNVFHAPELRKLVSVIF